MKNEKLTVLHLKANSLTPEVITIDHSIKAMQNLVGSRYFDIVPAASYLPDILMKSPLAKYDIFIDDESLLVSNPQPNICLNPLKLKTGELDYAGILFGDIFLAGRDGERTISIDLTDVCELTQILIGLLLKNQARLEVM
mgnify:CR=1 FL=1